jgi:hypothetical protein
MGEDKEWIYAQVIECGHFWCTQVIEKATSWGKGAQAIEHKEREKCPWAWAEDKEK